MKEEIRILTVDPVGTPVKIKAVDDYVDNLTNEEPQEKRKWWSFLKRRKRNLFSVVKYILNSLDDLIGIIDLEKISGKDKKATVLNAVNIIYDYIIREAMPIWLRPFSNKIKSLIINVIISTFIDWIVGKYKQGQIPSSTIVVSDNEVQNA